MSLALTRALTLTSLLLTGCYFPEVTLTPAQETLVQQSLLTAPPTPQRALNVDFGDQVRLIGLDLSARTFPS